MMMPGYFSSCVVYLVFSAAVFFQRFFAELDISSAAQDRMIVALVLFLFQIFLLCPPRLLPED